MLKNFFKRMVIATNMDHLANELDGRRILIKESKIIQETISELIIIYSFVLDSGIYYEIKRKFVCKIYFF